MYMYVYKVEPDCWVHWSFSLYLESLFYFVFLPVIFKTKLNIILCNELYEYRRTCWTQCYFIWMSQFMSLGCEFMEFVKRLFNWWKHVKYIVHHFPTRERASYYISYLAQSWQPFLATKDLWWIFNKYVSRTDWTERDTIRRRLLKPKKTIASEVSEKEKRNTKRIKYSKQNVTVVAKSRSKTQRIF